MPRGTILKIDERAVAKALKEEGLSMRDIARKLGRSNNVVQNFFKDPDGYGQRKYPGRKPALKNREIRAICRLASNSSISIRKIKATTKVAASPSTVWRAIRDNPMLVRAKMKKAPQLQPRHLAARRAFARKVMDADWSQVHNQIRLSNIRINGILTV